MKLKTLPLWGFLCIYAAAAVMSNSVEASGPMPETDVTMQKQVLPVGAVTFELGAQALYTITVENLSAVQAQMVLIEDELPVQVSYVSDNCGGVAIGNSWSWDIGDLNAMSLNSCDILVDILQGGVVTNTATVSRSTADSDVNNNQDQATFEILLGGPVNVPVNSSLALMVLLSLVLLLSYKKQEKFK